MTWKKHDGQLALRAKIASELVADGLPAQEAEQRATSMLLAVRKIGISNEIHVGNTVFIVEVKDA